MLVVNARSGHSTIDGFGLIACEFIPAGSKVWVFQPGFDLTFTEDQIQLLSPVAQNQVLYFAFFDRAEKHYVLSTDDDRFTNHSEDPNTRFIDGFTLAIKDIREGEEITCNYDELKGGFG